MLTRFIGLLLLIFAATWALAATNFCSDNLLQTMDLTKNVLHLNPNLKTSDHKQKLEPNLANPSSNFCDLKPRSSQSDTVNSSRTQEQRISQALVKTQEKSCPKLHYQHEIFQHLKTLSLNLNITKRIYNNSTNREILPKIIRPHVNLAQTFLYPANDCVAVNLASADPDRPKKSTHKRSSKSEKKATAKRDRKSRRDSKKQNKSQTSTQKLTESKDDKTSKGQDASVKQSQSQVPSEAPNLAPQTESLDTEKDQPNDSKNPSQKQPKDSEISTSKAKLPQEGSSAPNDRPKSPENKKDSNDKPLTQPDGDKKSNDKPDLKNDTNNQTDPKSDQATKDKNDSPNSKGNKDNSGPKDSNSSKDAKNSKDSPENKKSRSKDKASAKKERKLPPIKTMVTSPFGERRLGGITGVRIHTGVDLRAHLAWPVVAYDKGTIRSAGFHGRAGIMVEIDHPDGRSTAYAHLQIATVKAGDTVKKGDKIGEVGCTGYTTGAHLHFVLYNKDHTPIDPMKHLEVAEDILRPEPELIPEKLSPQQCNGQMAPYVPAMSNYKHSNKYGRRHGLLVIRSRSGKTIRIDLNALRNYKPQEIPLWTTRHRKK